MGRAAFHRDCVILAGIHWGESRLFSFRPFCYDVAMAIKTTTIKQSIRFKASPHEIYQALLDAKEHSAFTGGIAKITPVVGAAFEAYDGYITGRNLQLKEDKKIVQAWRAEEDGWPEDLFSRVTIELKETKTGTEVSFTQTGVPIAHAKSIRDGWEEYYWRPLKRMLEESR